MTKTGERYGSMHVPLWLQHKVRAALQWIIKFVLWLYKTVVDEVYVIKNTNSRVANATLNHGVLETFCTCVLIAPAPLAVVLWMLNCSVWHAFLLHALIFFSNVGEKFLRYKWRIKCVVWAAVTALLYRIWYWPCFHAIVWAPVLVLSTFDMKGYGLEVIFRVLSAEAHLYYLLMSRLLVWRCKMTPQEQADLVKSNEIIYKPSTFLW